MRHALGWSFASILVGSLLAGCGGSSAPPPPPAPTCTDGTRNGAETGTDCGGPSCPRCANGAGCAGATDCLNGNCVAGTCRSPDCSDGLKNGSETAVDCGGTCAPCADGLACGQPADCRSGVCSGGSCAAPACMDAVKNGDETGIDCGGSCAGCLVGGTCAGGTDCASGACQDGSCRPATCANLAKDAAETDVDCGGPDCAPCALTKACVGGNDCVSQLCQAGHCRPATCANGTKDGTETAVDCGGACAPCGSGSACGINADCLGGTCGAGVCLRAAGETCSSNGQCAAGFCADGVCCESACGGTCEACNLPGRAGRCDALPAGQASTECPADPVSSCGGTGSCSGARSCALYSNGTVCAPASCLSPTVAAAADTCNGGGACVDAGTTDCAPYGCNAASGACRTSCASNGDCAAGSTCSGGTCRLVKAAGQACTGDVECGSGFCTDGVCCGSRCGGICEKCNQAPGPGVCSAIAFGQDPDNECPADAPATCGQSGTCSGARSCGLYPAGTQCAAPSCVSATTANRADTCSGTGTCSDAGVQDCSPYACSGGSGSCLTTCSVDGDCAAGFACAASVCKRPDGGVCTVSADCASGACCAGLCRNTLTDPSNCGGCGSACVLPNATASCTGGACNVAACNASFSNCDGSPATGCETAINTLSDCGGCAIACSRANATASCATGTCATSACNAGYDSCDGNDANGCELAHAPASNSCTTPVDLGTTCGELQRGGLGLCSNTSTQVLGIQAGTSGGWFKVHVQECSSAAPTPFSTCTDRLSLTVKLAVPPGIDYDLFVHTGAACGVAQYVSQNGPGGPEQITLNWTDTAADDSLDVWIEVRYFGGSSCSPWTLTVEGRNSF
jgi:hypothetical protein